MPAAFTTQYRFPIVKGRHVKRVLLSIPVHRLSGLLTGLEVFEPEALFVGERDLGGIHAVLRFAQLPAHSVAA